MIEMPMWMFITWIIFTFVFGLEVSYEIGKKKGIKFMSSMYEKFGKKFKS